jgi:diguanylate cyclase (GGDEF)-like protein
LASYDLDPRSGSLASLLAAMDCIAFEVVGTGLRAVSAAPEWFDSLPRSAGGVFSVLPFLELFVPQAMEFRAEGNAGRFQSDFWTQTSVHGQEIHLLAFAARIDGRELVVVRSAQELYAERQTWQLYAHQTAMQLQIIERLKCDLEDSARALSAANAQLSELSIRDGLTGLYNRRHFDQVFAAELHRAMRSAEPLSLLFMDIDKFKLLNDTYGHSAGDDCLRSVGRVLGDAGRRPTDLVARYGGEEFAVLLPGTDAADALQIAHSICGAVRGLQIPNQGSEVYPYVTMSIGVYTRQPMGNRTMAQIFEAADAALYRAKSEGRNRVVVAGARGGSR